MSHEIGPYCHPRFSNMRTERGTVKEGRNLEKKPLDPLLDPSPGKDVTVNSGKLKAG